MFSLVFSIQLPRSCRNQTCQGKKKTTFELQDSASKGDKGWSNPHVPSVSVPSRAVPCSCWGQRRQQVPTESICHCGSLGGRAALPPLPAETLRDVSPTRCPPQLRGVKTLWWGTWWERLQDGENKAFLMPLSQKRSVCTGTSSAS